VAASLVHVIFIGLFCPNVKTKMSENKKLLVPSSVAGRANGLTLHTYHYYFKGLLALSDTFQELNYTFKKRIQKWHVQKGIFFPQIMQEIPALLLSKFTNLPRNVEGDPHAWAVWGGGVRISPLPD